MNDQNEEAITPQPAQAQPGQSISPNAAGQVPGEQTAQMPPQNNPQIVAPTAIPEAYNNNAGLAPTQQVVLPTVVPPGLQPPTSPIVSAPQFTTSQPVNSSGTSKKPLFIAACCLILIIVAGILSVTLLGHKNTGSGGANSNGNTAATGKFYDDKNVGIQAIYPEGWTFSDDNSISGIKNFSAANATAHSANDTFAKLSTINIDESPAEDVGDAQSTLESYVQTIPNADSQGTTDFKLISQTNETVDGQPASLSQESFTEHGVAQLQNDIVVLYNNNEYGIIINAPVSKWSGYEAAFQTFIKSIKFDG